MDQRAARQAARRRGYVGRYQMGPGTITITKQNGQLMRKLSELPPFEMYPTRRDFYITNFDARFGNGALESDCLIIWSSGYF